jgi:hypothetical protein
MFAMKPCVGLYISGILTEDFDSIAKTIQTFFGCSEDKPAAFDDWAKNIAYDIVKDEAIFVEKGIEVFPMLEIDGGPLMDFSTARKWVDSQED